MSNYRIERIHPDSEELDLLVRMYTDVFAHPPWGEQHRPVDVRKTFERVLSYPEAIVLVALDSDNVQLGAALAFSMERKAELRLRLSRPGRGLFIDELFVAAFAHQRGIGAALAAKVVAAAQSDTFDYAVISTSVYEPAIRHLFCDRHKFTVAFEDDYQGRHLLPTAILPTRRLVLVGSL